MQIKNKYGYVRVSSKSQESNSSIESQKQQLIQNGIEEQNIFVEVGSGANEIKNRSVFQKLINQKLKENDLLMVTKIDRCSRNTLEFLKLQDILFKKNITFVALDLPTSVDLATNRLQPYQLWPNLKIIDEKIVKNKESGLLKKKESIRDGKQ